MKAGFISGISKLSIRSRVDQFLILFTAGAQRTLRFALVIFVDAILLSLQSFYTAPLLL